MGKIITTTLDRFDGGMANDVRDRDATKCRLSKNFDALSFPHRLVPYRSSESGNDTASRNLTDFLYLNSRLYALGNPSSLATVYYKDTFTDGTWSTTSNNAAAADVGGTDGSRFFLYYKKTAKIYFPIGTNIAVYDPTGSTAIADAGVAHNFAAGTAAIVHSKDDIMYYSYYHSTNGAIVGKNDNGSFTQVALTIGPRYVITNLSEYGNYLAIACRQVDQLNGPSRVFLWNRDSSLTTLDESIDWGFGDIRVLEEYNGVLLGISLLYESSVIEKTQLIVRYFAGSAGAQEVLRLTGETGAQAIVLLSQKHRKDNRIYFLHSGYYDGVYQSGLWSLGRDNANQPLSLNFERPANNDTAVTSLDGFGFAGDYCFIAYDGAGAVSKTTDTTTTYSATSIRETTKFGNDNVSLKKKLLGVTVTHVPLPTAGQVVLKYKIDAETSWTTIFTHSTDDSLSHSAVNIESSGANLPEYNEIQFRIESQGGAEITSLSFDAEVTGKRPY